MKIKSLVVVIGSVFLISSCAAPSVTELKSPDGRNLKNVKCNIDPQKCFVAATESCKGTNGTYSVISSHSNAGGTAADIIPGPVTWYNMTIACGPSDGKMPTFKFQGPTYSPPPTIINQQRNKGSSTTSCTGYGNTINCTTY